MHRPLRFALTALFLLPATLSAQATPANPITSSELWLYTMISTEILQAAQKMPADNYAFRPTPDVRTFGQLVGHVTDAQYSFCATASGEPNPSKGIEKTVTAKTDLILALESAITYCHKTFAGMTDAKGAKTVKLATFEVAKLTVLSGNTAHINEHYGNMVTYLRLKGIVPPSSENQSSPGQK
jgi:uncharacterized damage-inducible protein DinB